MFFIGRVKHSWSSIPENGFEISIEYIFFAGAPSKLDGNLEKGAHVSSNIFYLIYLLHLIIYRDSQKQSIFFRKDPIFLLCCSTCSELPSTANALGPLNMVELIN